MVSQLIHQRWEQGRQIIVYVCAVIMLLQLIANAVGIFYDPCPTKDETGFQSIHLDVGFPNISPDNCRDHCCCHYNFQAFMLHTSGELVLPRVIVALTIDPDVSIPFPPFSTLFKPPIA